MALKGDRYELETAVEFFMNEDSGAAERGGIVTLSTVGSGSALDQSKALVTYASAQSGVVPIGILLNDVVNIDQTRQHIRPANSRTYHRRRRSRRHLDLPDVDPLPVRSRCNCLGHAVDGQV